MEIGWDDSQLFIYIFMGLYIIFIDMQNTCNMKLEIISFSLLHIFN